MRSVIEFVCANILHRMHWIPLWNRSALLCCPVNWLSWRSPRFEAWFWREPEAATSDM